jgi:hypothetical protein
MYALPVRGREIAHFFQETIVKVPHLCCDGAGTVAFVFHPFAPSSAMVVFLERFPD